MVVGPLRALAKRGSERLLRGLGVGALGRRIHRRDSLVLGYHNVVPHGVSIRGDASLHLPQHVFAAQLDFLQRHFDVVSLSDLWQPGASHDRPRVAITFDDGYAGAVRSGVEELTTRGLPATFFVVPAMIGRRTFWWDAVADGFGGRLDAAWRTRALEVDGGDDERVRRRALAEGVQVCPMPEEGTTATVDELSHAIRHPGITIGSHTMTHAYLPALAPGALVREVRDSLQWLRARWPATTGWLSYPYGGSSVAATTCAREAGYKGALLIDGGWIHGAGPEEPLAIPRLNVPAGVSLDGFALRLSGLGWSR